MLDPTPDTPHATVSAEPEASPAYAKARSFAVLGVLRIFEALGYRTTPLLEGLSLRTDRLHDPSAQMDWDDFLLLLERLRELVGDEAGMEEGAFQLVVRNPMIRGLANAIRSPQQVLLRLPAFMGGSLYTHLAGHARPAGDDMVQFHHLIPANCRTSRLFLRMSRGLLRAYPCLLGLPEAQVRMGPDLHQTTFHVTVPPGGSARRRTGDPAPPPWGQPWYTIPGEERGERYLEIFNDPGGNLARIRYLTERLSSQDDAGGFAKDLMSLFKELFGCTYARLSLTDTSGAGTITLAVCGSRPCLGIHTFPLVLRNRPVGCLEVDPVTATQQPFVQIIGTLIPFLSLALAQCCGPARTTREADPSGSQHRNLRVYASIHRLTPRERDILHLLARGLTNKEIAQELGTSLRTIENQVAGMLRKTSAASRLDLLARALA